MLRSFHQVTGAGKLVTAGSFVAAGCAAAAPLPRSPDPPSVVVAAPEPSPSADEEPLQDHDSTCTPKLRPSKGSRPIADLAVSEADPHRGRFELGEAIQGLRGRWPLIAEIETDHGALTCELWDQVAPLTVANFVGLARGLRAWKNGGSWVRQPAYDGGSFHRVIPGFMIQGGDPLGTGAGEAGYLIPDEIDESIAPDRAGLLYMAHRGKNTASMQFFILDAPAPHLHGSYAVFGHCTPEEVIHAIAAAPKIGERPDPRIGIHRIRVGLTPGCE